MSSEVTLFLIEDDDIDAMTVERALHDCQVVNPVVRARDGLEALELLHAGKVPKPYENFIAGYFVKEASGTETLKIAELLKGYWRIACLPEDGTRMGTL